MGLHEANVRRIASTVRALYDRREPYRIFHGSTNSTRPIQRDRVVDISAMSNVVNIDPLSKVAVVEPNVPMDKLIAATLEHGLIPPVVMEFPGITVGGGYAGSSGESSSFKYGFFDRNVIAVEMILANGDIVTASEFERPDLFKAAAGALGTLGITSLIKLRLISAKKFVKTTYHRRNNVHDTIHAIRQETENPTNDYIDGIMFSNSHGVVITGQLTDDKPESTKPQTFSKAWDPWFYLHAKENSDLESLSSPVTDYIPLAEYLFRYDRGGFWVGVEAVKYFGLVPFNRMTRWFLDDFMHTRMLFRALHGSNGSFDYMVQDLSLPYSTAEKFIDYTSQELAIWPLWLCPVRGGDPPTFHPHIPLTGPGDEAQSMLNIGLWGRASSDLDTFVQQNRQLESKVAELGGRKVLYSHTYYTEQEFWQLYDRKWYDDLRQRYWARSLPTIYDKVKVDMGIHERQKGLPWIQRLGLMRPFAGVIGVFWAIRSKDYLLHRQPSWRDK